MKTNAGNYAIVSVNGLGSTPRVVSLPSSGYNLISAAYNSNSDYKDEWKIHRMLPLSGSELEFGMLEWTDDGCMRLNVLNCYAYAINNQIGPNGTIYARNDPGCYSSGEYLSSDFAINPETNGIIESAMVADFNAYNTSNGTNLICQAIGRYDVCRQGTYKIALVVNPLEDGEDASVIGACDYHWYRQDSDGLWSHKHGRTDPTREDESGKLIIDPQTANRGEYTVFVGYFEISPWNQYYGNRSLSSEDMIDYQYSYEGEIFDLSLFDSLRIGMPLTEVYEIVGSLGLNAGSGRFISKYRCSEGTAILIEYTYNSELDTLVVSGINYKQGGN